MPLYLRIQAVVADWEVDPEVATPHLTVPENIPTYAVPAKRWHDVGDFPRDPQLDAITQKLGLDVIQRILKDVVASDELKKRIELVQKQDVPLNYGFSTSPPPSPRAPGDPIIAKFGPTEPGLGNVQKDKPPTLGTPRIDRENLPERPQTAQSSMPEQDVEQASDFVAETSQRNSVMSSYSVFEPVRAGSQSADNLSADPPDIGRI